MNETRGRFKSQRRGPGDALVKGLLNGHRILYLRGSKKTVPHMMTSVSLTGWQGLLGASKKKNWNVIGPPCWITLAV